jgi:hypothetical protein
MPIVATGVTVGKRMVVATEDDWEQMSDELSAGGMQTPIPTSVCESCPVQPGKQHMPSHGDANSVSCHEVSAHLSDALTDSEQSLATQQQSGV